MIHVCLLPSGLKYVEFESFIKSTVNPLDLVIHDTPSFRLKKYKNVICPQNVNLEKLAGKRFLNILFVDYKYIDKQLITKIISMTCIKSEIFALTFLNNELTNIILEIQEYKKAGLSSKEILLLTRLKYNYSDEIINQIYSKQFLTQNSNIRKIKNFDDIKPLWKI